MSESTNIRESSLPPMLRVPEVALALSVGRSTVYALLNSGKLGSVRIAGCRRIPASALVDYLTAQAA